MRILLLIHAFNSLSQRLFTELAADGHELSVEFDVHDDLTEEAVGLFRPDVVLAPYLRRAIPESVYAKVPCLVVHPGVRGDRGPSALDHAILRNETNWGVTVLQATGEFDAGDVWAFAEFPMREARKSSLYRNEVTEGAVRAVREALSRLQSGNFRPEPLDYSKPDFRGTHHPPCRQADRAIHWGADSVQTILRKIRSADGQPGLRDGILGEDFFFFNAFPESNLAGPPGKILATRDEAICIGTGDGAIWVTHLRGTAPDAIKLPAARVCSHLLAVVPERPAAPGDAFREIVYEEANGVGYLHFDFYNGAMSTQQCLRLRDAFREAARRPIRVLVLFGSADFWSNGIHLGTIEAAESPADESMRNIEAMDDLCLAILEANSVFTMAALQGNAGAGGVFFALAADRVVARKGIVLNPHYRSMGNLYGSEYWTYLLPGRVDREIAAHLIQNRLPVSAVAAKEQGLIDDVFSETPDEFRSEVRRRAEALAASTDFDNLLTAKRMRRTQDERARPLQSYRDEELERMRLNFYGFDPSYHIARYNFVHRVPHARTPLYLAAHRRRAASFSV